MGGDFQFSTPRRHIHFLMSLVFLVTELMVQSGINLICSEVKYQVISNTVNAFRIIITALTTYMLSKMNAIAIINNHMHSY